MADRAVAQIRMIAGFSSASILARLVAPLSEEHFLRQNWGKVFLFAPGAAADLKSIFSWNQLNRAIEQHRLDYPRLRLEVNHKRVDSAEYTMLRPTRRGDSIARIDVAKVNALVRTGATLILDAVDEISPDVGLLCEDLTRLFCTHIQANAYATTEHTPGFGLHWDDHDVFIIQVSGRKRWKVYDFTRRWPLYRDTAENPPPKTAPIWDSLLAAGDVLYIPRGQWHDVIAVDEPTLHLTIGINNATAVNLFSWITDDLRSVDAFRQDLPLFETVEEKIAYSRRLLEAINHRWSDSIVDEYSASQRAHLTARPHVSFPFGAVRQGLPDGSTFRFRFSGSTSSLLPSQEASEITCSALGKEWRFSPALKDLLGSLLARNTLSFTEALGLVGNAISQEKLRVLLAELLSQGFIFIVPDEKQH